MTVYNDVTTLDDYQRMDNIELASTIYTLREQAKDRLEQADRAAEEMLVRMERTGATAVDHPGLMVKLEMPSPAYDPDKLRRLYEVAPKEEVDKAVTPAHDEVVHVAEKWSAVKFKTLLKYGAPVFEVINAAMLPGGRPRLKITAREMTK